MLEMLEGVGTVKEFNGDLHGTAAETCGARKFHVTGHLYLVDRGRLARSGRFAKGPVL